MFNRLLLLTLIFFASTASQAQVILSKPGTSSAAIAQSVMPVCAPGSSNCMYVDKKTIIGRRNNDDGQVRFHVSCDMNANPSCFNNPNNSDSPRYYPFSSDPNSIGGNGAIRINCAVSHQSFDDPIVWPGHPAITHLHTFVGNDSTSALASPEDLKDLSLHGKSTCVGGTINNSGYWFPTPILHCGVGAIGCIPHGMPGSRDGEVQHFEALANVYYKCDAAGGGPNCTTNGTQFPYKCNGPDNGPPCLVVAEGTPGASHAFRWAPVGFRYIVGNASQRGYATNTAVKTMCVDTQRQFLDIPTSAEAAHEGGCTSLNIFVNIPNCWDGVNLDSPNHSSHAAPQYGGGSSEYICSDPAYPIPIMAPGMNQHYTIKNQSDLDYIRYSSAPPCADEGGPAGDFYDTTGAPFLCNGKPHNGQTGGATLHMDWMNGWSHAPNAGGFGRGSWTDLFLKGCINLGLSPYQGIDCHDNNFGSPLNDGLYYQLGK